MPTPRPAVGPVGAVTRGTTGPNRLRRVDRWAVATCGPALRRAADPLVVDLGFGALPVTTAELAGRLRAVRADVEVVGLEISPERVAQAQRDWARPGLSFALGGFEMGLPGPSGATRRPVLARAFNVLRQYDLGEVQQAWALMCSRLAPGGTLIEGTCDELGRRAVWVGLGTDGPRTISLSWQLGAIEPPSAIAERLPKALIHDNVPGQPVHTLLTSLDRAWALHAGLSPWGRRQRFLATVATLRREGWPVLDGPSRWRLGELTLPWAAVAPPG